MLLTKKLTKDEMNAYFELAKRNRAAYNVALQIALKRINVLQNSSKFCNYSEKIKEKMYDDAIDNVQKAIPKYDINKPASAYTFINIIINNSFKNSLKYVSRNCRAWDYQALSFSEDCLDG